MEVVLFMFLVYPGLDLGLSLLNCAAWTLPNYHTFCCISSIVGPFPVDSQEGDEGNSERAYSGSNYL